MVASKVDLDIEKLNEFEARALQCKGISSWLEFFRPEICEGLIDVLRISLQVNVQCEEQGYCGARNVCQVGKVGKAFVQGFIYERYCAL